MPGALLLRRPPPGWPQSQEANECGSFCIGDCRFQIADCEEKRMRGTARRAMATSLTCGRRSRIFLQMINVTENAVRQLQSLLSEAAEDSPKGLRVQVAKGGCSGLHYGMT